MAIALMVEEQIRDIGRRLRFRRDVQRCSRDIQKTVKEIEKLLLGGGERKFSVETRQRMIRDLAADCRSGLDLMRDSIPVDRLHPDDIRQFNSQNGRA